MSPVLAVRRFVNRQFEQWLARRSPARSSVRLDQGQIYIFPSRVGLGFLGLLLLLLVMAINYQNNLIFGLTFGLFSLFLVSILHTFANLYGLVLKAGPADPVFAGELAHFHLYTESGKRPRYQLQLGFNGQSPVIKEIDMPRSTIEVRLPWPTQRRGYMKPARLRVRSDFPLGLLRCWSLPALDWQCLVYPQPKLLMPLQTAESEGEGGLLDRIRDSDEFSGFKRYEMGEPPRRIYWKGFAKGQELLSKHYQHSLASDMILDWDTLDGLGVEDRLSVLCAWALQCSERGIAFALRLPSVQLDSGTGAGHLAAVLRELALYGETS